MKLVHITKRPKVWFLKKGGAFNEMYKGIVDEKMTALSNMREISKNIKKMANEQFKKYLGR